MRKKHTLDGSNDSQAAYWAKPDARNTCGAARCDISGNFKMGKQCRTAWYRADCAACRGIRCDYWRAVWTWFHHRGNRSPDYPAWRTDEDYLRRLGQLSRGLRPYLCRTAAVPRQSYAAYRKHCARGNFVSTWKRMALCRWTRRGHFYRYNTPCQTGDRIYEKYQRCLSRQTDTHLSACCSRTVHGSDGWSGKVPGTNGFHGKFPQSVHPCRCRGCARRSRIRQHWNRLQSTGTWIQYCNSRESLLHRRRICRSSHCIRSVFRCDGRVVWRKTGTVLRLWLRWLLYSLSTGVSCNGRTWACHGLRRKSNRQLYRPFGTWPRAYLAFHPPIQN